MSRNGPLPVHIRLRRIRNIIDEHNPRFAPAVRAELTQN